MVPERLQRFAYAGLRAIRYPDTRAFGSMSTIFTRISWSRIWPGFLITTSRLRKEKISSRSVITSGACKLRLISRSVTHVTGLYLKTLDPCLRRGDVLVDRSPVLVIPAQAGVQRLFSLYDFSTVGCAAPYVPGSLKCNSAIKPGSLSLNSSLALCICATAATRLRPRPLPCCERL